MSSFTGYLLRDSRHLAVEVIPAWKERKRSVNGIFTIGLILFSTEFTSLGCNLHHCQHNEQVIVHRSLEITPLWHLQKFYLPVQSRSFWWFCWSLCTVVKSPPPPSPPPPTLQPFPERSALVLQEFCFQLLYHKLAYFLITWKLVKGN